MSFLLVISPALWNDPFTRARDLGSEMTAQVNLVVDILPDAPTTIQERIEGVLTEPFIKPVQFFEQESWADAAPIQQEIQAYMASPLSGLQAGGLGGVVLMGLVVVGLYQLLWMLWRALQGTKTHTSASGSVLVLVCLGVTLANLLINPIPWQRYYLPLIPVYAVLIGVAVNTFLLHWRASAAFDSEPEPAT